MAVVGAWLVVLLAVAAPVLEANRWGRVPAVYELLSYLCHQRPSRSWFLLGSNLGVCARCFATYASLAIAGGALLASGQVREIFRRLQPGWGAFLLAPLVVDGTLQLVGVWTSTNLLRAVTGVGAGLGLLRLGLLVTDGGHEWLRRPPAPSRVLQRLVSVAIILALGLQAPAMAQARRVSQEVHLKAETPVFLVVPDGLSSSNARVGQTIPMRVLRDVKAGGVTVIRAGAEATGVIVEAKDAGTWGRKGVLGIRVQSVQAVDGQLIPLGATQRVEGKGSEGTASVTAGVTGAICFPFLLLGFLFKGENVSLPPGAEVKAFTDVEVTVAGLGAGN
jgi:uncharacterized membrane protein